MCAARKGFVICNNQAASTHLEQLLEGISLRTRCFLSFLSRSVITLRDYRISVDLIELKVRVSLRDRPSSQIPLANFTRVLLVLLSVTFGRVRLHLAAVSQKKEEEARDTAKNS